MDVSNIDMIYYSFELNLANPNGEDFDHNIKFMKDHIHLMIINWKFLADDISDDEIDTDYRNTI